MERTEIKETMKKIKDNFFVKSTFILGLVAFLSALALSHIKKITYPNILKQAEEKKRKALSLVLPGYKIVKEKNFKMNNRSFSFWEGKKNFNGAKTKGYAYVTSKSGYSGEIESMIGFDEQGKILGIYILQQSETPGLGARCLEVANDDLFWLSLFRKSKKKSSFKTPWFQEQYQGLNLNKKISILQKGDWKPSLKNELFSNNAITAITGATITSKAVTESLQKTFAFLKKEFNLVIPKEDSE